jgi:hypothetical protein
MLSDSEVRCSVLSANPSLKEKELVHDCSLLTMTIAGDKE